MPKRIQRQLNLPLLDEVQNFRNSFSFVEDSRKDFELPDYISQNLKHKLRNYQIEALFNLNYTQHDFNADTRFNQLLFNMATGSGKTDEMAASILYFYQEFGYQNFLFVVNTNAVISKTRENLLNSQSPKYLFSQEISIDGNKLFIVEVSRFPDNPEPGVIYIRLTTIQFLSNEVSAPRENGLTYEDLARQPLIVLADEAHHFSAGTKNKNSNDRAWENVLDRIKQANKKNRQLEFTATIDLQNADIYHKYRDKIVFQYDLAKFQLEGYSKKIFRLQANNDDNSKMLNAVLLSQFRKHVAMKNGVPDFKPVILFKSNKIDVSHQMRQIFLQMINTLNSDKLKNFILSQDKITTSSTLKRAYSFFRESDCAALVVEIKHDFSALKTINVNDTAKDGMLGDLNDLKNLNSLEEVDNPFRAIFAVAKLSEGWDVLNLYDIVRIGEQSATINATNSEAQLIGRGARYNPFKINDQKSYTRRFDTDINDLSLLESLHYHTINETKYLENLKKSFDIMQLQVNDDSDFDVYTTKVKESFKKTSVYKFGQLFVNEIEDVPENEYDSLAKYGVPVAELPEVNIESGTVEAKVADDVTSTQTKKLSVYVDLRLLKKAMARNPFYRFSKLSQYIPTLTSMSEFIMGKNWLGHITTISAIVPYGLDDILSREQKLLVIQKYLAYIERMLIINFKKKRGTNKFKSIPIKENVKNYEKRSHKLLIRLFMKKFNHLTCLRSLGLFMKKRL